MPMKKHSGIILWLKFEEKKSVHYVCVVFFIASDEGWQLGYLITKGDQKVDDDAIGPTETALNLVLAAATSASS